MIPLWLALGLGLGLGMFIVAVIVGAYLKWLSRRYPPAPPEE